MIRHGLMASRCKINDAQAIMAQANLVGWVHVKTIVVRASMMQASHHGFQLRGLPTLTDYPANATHDGALNPSPDSSYDDALAILWILLVLTKLTRRSARKHSVFSMDSLVQPPICGVMMRLSCWRA